MGGSAYSAGFERRDAQFVLPVFDGEWLDPGTQVTAMGQYHPRKRELDATTVARATYVPDLRGRLDQDAGAYIQAREAGLGTPLSFSPASEAVPGR